MNIRSIIAIALMLVITACSAYRKEFDVNPAYAPHFFRSFDVEVAWQAERRGQELLLSGTVTNRRYAFLRDLELTIRLLDEKGAVLARETVADFPTYLPSGKSESFRTTLRFPASTAPARLRFGYTYQLAEEPPAFRGYGGYDDIPRFGHFDAPL